VVGASLRMLDALPTNCVRVSYLTMPVSTSAGEILEAVLEDGREEPSRAQHILRTMILAVVG
jgi:hypothetical protein